MAVTEDLIDSCSLWLFCNNTMLHFEVGKSDLKTMAPSKKELKECFSVSSDDV